MRKSRLVIVAGLIAMVLVPALLGQNLKIAFINTLEVLHGTEQGKSEIQKFNQFAAQKQQEMAARTSELQKLQEQYSTQERTLNPETRAEMQRTIQDRDRQLKRLQEDAQVELEQRQAQLLSQMSEKIQTIINDYAPKNGYGVIFLRDQSQTYVATSLDITQEIVRLYNEKYPLPGQAAPAAPPPAPAPQP